MALALLAAACGAFAEPVKITFLPPPMEGIISLGVYDAAGKLVRVLHREIEPGELTKGDDGLETQWDGKDDQGKPCPPGTYRARGVMVGDLGVEGIGFIGNDWVDDADSPRVRRIDSLAMNNSGTPAIQAWLADQPRAPFFYSMTMKPTAPTEDPEVKLIPEPKTPAVFTRLKAPVPIRGIAKESDWSAGTSHSTWVIADASIQQYSSKGQVLRALAPQPGDPPPVKLAAFTTEDKLYVLYENATLQRLRGYDFTGVKPGDEPKVLFEQDIRASDTYEQIASELKFPDEKPFVPSPTLTVALVPNPLDHNKPGTLEIKACINRAGCYLATTDGLPLTHISDTRFLRWAVMGRPAGSKAITVCDGDGAVVEQFQIAASANMMAFDAGAIPWPGEPASPSPSPSPTSSPTPAPSATPLASPTATPAAPPKR